MQLKKPKQIRSLLTAATSSLLAGVAQQGLAAQADDIQVDSAFLYYAEKDRVTVLEPVVRLRKEIGDDEFINTRLVVDTMSGASPNGAIPTDSPQTFASPSGESGYTTPAGETPLDSTFRDTRAALSVDWEKPLHERLKAVFGGNFSKEYDYASLGLSATFSWDLNQRNTTLTAGLSLSRDEISPTGGAPIGLSPVPTVAVGSKGDGDDDDDDDDDDEGGDDDSNGRGSNNKDVQELLFGVTQVLGPKTLVQLNYTIAHEQGYLTDPYKLLSVLDSTGQLRSIDPYLFEKRPDNRRRQALYTKGVQQFGDDVLQASYRYYWDDWGVVSHTVDMHYRYEMAGGRHYLQPHVRYYRQSKADFYHYALQDGAIPNYASADYRLGDMSTTSYGLKYGMVLGEFHEFGVRLESMQQQATGDAPFEDNTALIFQLSYSFVF